ncbi:MAG: hypothetical protein Q4G71_02605 [Pseudomonadota bacterium]|nr:hypothetical protein [Pseudomonadota bacterium]
MNRPGWNPGRRNRHVGTGAHGHGQNNALVIPDPTRGHLTYAEQLGKPVCVLRNIAGVPMRFFVQAPSSGFFHPCTVDDVCTLLSHCPPEDWRKVDFIVMRQPTRKQQMLRAVWGQAVWHFQGVPAPGPAIVLQAQSLAPFSWSRSLTPDDVRELDRLRMDGHEVQPTRRHWRIVSTPAAVRHTMLFRTLLHEIGHHVDHAEVLATDVWWSELTPKRKEDFAHRYAEKLFARLHGQGVLPFAQQALDEQALAATGMQADWFKPPDS